MTCRIWRKKKALRPKNLSGAFLINERVSTFAETKQFERENILRALSRTGWKIFGAGGAAELLGIPPTTLAARIQRLGLKEYKPV